MSAGGVSSRQTIRRLYEVCLAYYKIFWLLFLVSILNALYLTFSIFHVLIMDLHLFGAATPTGESFRHLTIDSSLFTNTIAYPRAPRELNTSFDSISFLDLNDPSSFSSFTFDNPSIIVTSLPFGCLRPSCISVIPNLKFLPIYVVLLSVRLPLLLLSVFF